MSTTVWNNAQDWERAWWGNCCHTIGEELKQFSYFHRLGLHPLPYKFHKFNFVYDMHDATVLDIGGGPSSFLLKCINVKGTVVDPCPYPGWVYQRYASAGITTLVQPGETPIEGQWDEVWLYNVLQHTQDPELVVSNARRAGKLLRFFDWLDYGVHDGHPHNLTEEKLNLWLDSQGTVEMMAENDAHGVAYYGVFPQ